MRILYLLYAQQNSFTDLSINVRAKFPWADKLLDEIVKCRDVTVALAIPVNEKSFQTRQVNEITLFGLPNHKGNFFGKFYQRIMHSSENEEVNSYACQAISEFKPDIIQIFGTENPFGLIISQQNIPVIIHIQGSLMVLEGKWFTGISRWEQFRYAGFKDLLLLRGSYNEFISFKKRAAREAVIIKSCSYFMGRTSYDKRLVSLISPGSTYFHCEEFIRKIFFEKQWDFPLGNEITCISILKGTSYKGIDLLVEVMIILKKYSTCSFTFKICGVAENESIITIIKNKYKEDFKNLHLEFLGRLTSDELVENLCNSNFYIHPSFIENSPNSVCEAMALGMPVISTNTGGTSSLINDSIEGILVQEGEPYSMAAAIINLINNYDYAKLLGKNARKISLTRHDPDQIVKTLLSIYKTILFKNDRK